MSNLTVSHRRCNSLRGSIVCRLLWIDVVQEGLRKNKVVKISIPSISNFPWLSPPWSEAIPHDMLDKLLTQEFSEFYSTNRQFEMRYETRELSALINALRGVPDLIKTSSVLENTRIRTQWKLIFGMVFLEKYFENQDLEYFIHGIWRISQFKAKKKHSLLNSALDKVLAYCREIEPMAYKKYEELNLNVPSCETSFS